MVAGTQGEEADDLNAKRPANLRFVYATSVMFLLSSRILIGVFIFVGLLFCGWWTFRVVVEGIEGELATLAATEPGDLSEVSRELKEEALREWSMPIVVYIIMLLLVAFATADECRRAAHAQVE
jgi:hypothetical protein